MFVCFSRLWLDSSPDNFVSSFFGFLVIFVFTPMTNLENSFSLKKFLKNYRENVEEAGFTMADQVLLHLLKADVDPGHISAIHVGMGWGSNGEWGNLQLETNWI